MNVSVRDLLGLLSRHIKKEDRVLEIGFAPGKHLAYLAAKLRARVSGLDYSEQGVAFAKRLFGQLRIEGDLRCEDVFATTFPNESFDLVYSVGVIEHFDDPADIVRRHVELVRPGGTALILIPNYAGIYGKLQRHVDPASLEIHNLEIMNEARLLELVPSDLVASADAFPAGRVNLWQVSLEKKWPAMFARPVQLIFNGVGLMQPFDIARLCPVLVLVMKRRDVGSH
jgi:SAM-dependent methyltransferase